MKIDAEIAIIGAGIAGASLAASLAPERSVLLLEREEQPGYHATGRSAAYFAPAYGSDTVRAISHASRGFFASPPEGFSQARLLQERDALYIADGSQLTELSQFVASTERCESQSVDQCIERVPILKRAALAAGALQTGGGDLDVGAILQGFLNSAKRHGALLATQSEVLQIERRHDVWRISTPRQSYRVGMVVNAAGAWADQLAELTGLAPIGLTPKRRTALIVDAPDDAYAKDSPLTITIDEKLYFKPEAGQLLLSPADETPSVPTDAQAEEIDVAIAIDRFETTTDHAVTRVNHSWAGLRTFAPDSEFVSGFDPRAPQFYWLAGQGGYGVQSAPAMAEIAALNICGKTRWLDPQLAAVLATKIRPERLL